MVNRLSPEQLDCLQAAADANDPALYYQLLTEYGFGYGQVAREVVTDTGLYGRTANNFLREKLLERRIPLTKELRAQIMKELMDADLSYRKRGVLVTVDKIAEVSLECLRAAWYPAGGLDGGIPGGSRRARGVLPDLHRGRTGRSVAMVGAARGGGRRHRRPHERSAEHRQWAF
jgi:hypothetical protein